MTLVPLTAIVPIIALLLLLIGIAYAFLTYKTPFPPHLTFVAVGIGIFFTEAGIWLAILITVERVGFHWWLICYVIVGYLLTGVPMATGEIIKHSVTEKRNNKKIKKRYGQNR